MAMCPAKPGNDATPTSRIETSLNQKTAMSESNETTKSSGDPGSPRNVKFSELGIDLLKILKSKYPQATISGLVLMGLEALLKVADAAPVIRYMRMPGKEIIRLRALLAEARAALEAFRKDLLVARGTPAMLAPLAARTEEAIDKVEKVSDEVAAVVGVAQPTPEEIDQLELVALNLQAQIEMEETDESVREALRIGIKHLGFKLPATS